MVCVIEDEGPIGCCLSYYFSVVLDQLPRIREPTFRQFTLDNRIMLLVRTLQGESCGDLAEVYVMISRGSSQTICPISASRLWRFLNAAH